MHESKQETTAPKTSPSTPQAAEHLSEVREFSPPQPDRFLQRIKRGDGAVYPSRHADLLQRSGNSRNEVLLQLQRQHGNCYVQRVVELSRQGEGETDATPEIEGAIAQSRGGGQSLDLTVQRQMESAFGTNFSQVRVHTDSRADTLNHALSARAFTTGQDIFFRQGEYNPGSSSGKELLAHELTHVVQQTGGIQTKLAIGQPGDPYEQEADQVAQRVVHRLADATPTASAATATIPPPEPMLQPQAFQIQRKCAQCEEEVRRQPLSAEAALLVGGQGKRTEDEAAGKGAEMQRVPVAIATGTRLQRDLATPPPAIAPAPRADLTDAQIRDAITFNRSRYNEANTRLIQGLLGGPITGTWTEENIVAIAGTQAEYGLKKDGKIGFDTFQFLNREQQLEGMSNRTADCLTAFQLIGSDTPTITRTSPTQCAISGHFRTASQFSARCNCSEFQYRQFIRGHFRRERGGGVTDFSGIFNHLPSGNLTAAFQEDGDNTDVPPHYGHRDQPADNDPEDHYINNASADDQANGCRYRNEDFPGATTLNDCQAGDIFDVDMNFRGEIQRNGTAIQQKFWAAIRRRFTAPP